MPRIIETMRLLNYSPNKAGVCFGIAMMGSQAIVRNESQTFIDRINFISNASEEYIKSLAKPFDSKRQKAMHEQKIDLCSFFDELSIYQGKASVNQDFKSIVPNQCIYNVKNIGTDPEEIEENASFIYPTIAQNVVNLFTSNELFDFIMKTKRHLSGHSFSIIISHAPKDHATQIGFDAKQKKWFSSDHDFVVAGNNNFDDIEKVIDNIFASHCHHYDGIKRLAASFDILVSDANAPEIELNVLDADNFDLDQLTNFSNIAAISHAISCFEHAFRYDEIIEIFEKIKSSNLSEDKKIQLIHSKRASGLTLFHHLAGKGEAEALKSLLDKVAEMQLSADAQMRILNDSNNQYPPSLLIFALKYSQKNAVEVLTNTIKAIENESIRASILAATLSDDAQDAPAASASVASAHDASEGSGMQALLIATAKQQKEAAEAIVDAICSIEDNALRARLLEAKTNGISALLLAAKSGFTELTEALISGIQSLQDDQLKARLLEAEDAEGVSALLMAAANGHEEIVEKLTVAISSIKNDELRLKLLEAKDNDGVSALLIAAEEGYQTIVETFTKIICDIKDVQLRAKLLEVKRNDGTPALLTAAANGHLTVVNTLIDAILSIKDQQIRARMLAATDNNSLSALLIAEENGHQEVAKALAAAICGIKDQQERAKLLEAKDDDGIPLLLRSIANGRTGITEIIIKAICSIKDNQLRAQLLEAKSLDGVPALLVAQENGDEAVTKLLANAICDIDDLSLRAHLLKAECDSLSVLSMASINGHTEIAKILINAIRTLKKHTYLKAELLGAKDSNGFSALLLAASRGHTSIVRPLIRAISSIKDDQVKANLLGAKSDNGICALLIAAEQGHKEIVEILISAINDIENSETRATLLESKRNDGVSALMIAAENQHDEIVQILTHALSSVKTVSAPTFSHIHNKST